MSIRPISIPWGVVRWVVVIAIVGGAAATYRTWWSPLQRWVQSTTSGFRANSTAEESEAHGEPAHGESDHADHSAAPVGPAESIELSDQALLNLGLTEEFLKPVKLSTFPRSIRVPAIVVEQPGRTHTEISTPLTAIITRMNAVTGKVVKPGDLLFSLRLTHEELVRAQTEFLKLLAEIDVEQRELARLRGVMEGAIPGKLILDRQYAVERLQAQIDAQREALVLHGLSDEQVQRIEKEGKLLRTLELYAPGDGQANFQLTQVPESVAHQSDDPLPERAPAGGNSLSPAAGDRPSVMILEELRVHPGQAVTAGESLCVLADYGVLYIEGQAFEQDMADILASREKDWAVTAEFAASEGISRVEGLRIAFIANEIDIESRTLHFYVELENDLLPQSAAQDEQGFVTWRFRPGQRLTLSVQVDEWPDEIVLPVDAVARDGAESYVFLQDGKSFVRKPVHVIYRDQASVVIAKNENVWEGDVVALRGAYQLQMALKNKSGAGVDPHAGHTH